MTLGKLGNRAILVFAHYRWQMNKYRWLPAQELVQQYVLWSGGDELSTTNYMADAHEMVIDNISKIVCRHTITLKDNLILKSIAGNGNVTMHHIIKYYFASKRHPLTYYIWLALCKVLVNGFLRQVAAGPVITAEALSIASLLLLMLLLTAVAAEAAICVSLFNELLSILLVNIHTLALDIWAAVTADIRSLIWNDMGSSQGAVYKIYCICYIALLVSILNAEQEVAFICSGVEITIECSAKVSDMHIAGWAWCETGAYTICHSFFLQ